MSEPGAGGASSNLLIIMSDEHQARAMGCAGADFMATPHLDGLAARGTRFANAYTPSPICVPARASFATGRHVHETRMWDNAMPYDGSIPGWGHALQAAGVDVESIGKLHYRKPGDPAGFDAEHLPMMVKDGVGMVWASIRAEAERVSPKSRMLGDYIGPGSSPYTEFDDAVTRRTMDWLAARGKAGADRPWCLFVGLVAPHFPLVVDRAYFDLYPRGTWPEPKLNPSDGYVRHPWVEAQNALMDSEAEFADPAEREAAVSAYYGLCSWMDHNVGRILAALDAAGLAEDTTVIYTSDHGDNVGARGLWGKSNFYEEAVTVPMIMAGPDVGRAVCETPVSLLDLSATIAAHFGTRLDGSAGITSLTDIARAPPQPERTVFSQYHAAGAVSGGYMLRKGRWKLIHYEGFAPELFDLDADPEELRDRSGDADCRDVLAEMYAHLHAICDPGAVDAQAFADQAALIARHGGREAALKLGAPGATPPPETAP